MMLLPMKKFSWTTHIFFSPELLCNWPREVYSVCQLNDAPEEANLDVSTPTLRCYVLCKLAMPLQGFSVGPGGQEIPPPAYLLYCTVLYCTVQRKITTTDSTPLLAEGGRPGKRCTSVGLFWGLRGKRFFFSLLPIDEEEWRQCLGCKHAGSHQMLVS
jgi:hypothetical protein